ncbi:glycosyltransferase family 1 protein [Frondihabitans peucedani]|uniref:Glycosyltransferase family 1 protein n=1 Tax=Frondihabitans peucedani TaxID=598626 RepID=A0ABP8DZR0_9MICO
MSLSVLVDATSLPANAGGVGRYLLHLLPALAAAPDDGDRLRLVVACQARDRETWQRLAPGAEVVAVPAWARSVPGRLVWEQVGLPRLAARHRVDVIHSPHYTMPLLAGRPVVVTLHDATFFSHPQLHSRLKRTFFRFWTRYSVRRAAVCVTPSRATLDEVRRATRARLDTAVVAYHGIDVDRFHPASPSAITEVTRVFEGGGPYVAFVGTIEPRKNVVPLIEGFLRATDDERLAGWRLLVAGGAGWDDRAVDLLRSRRHHPRVQWTGFLDDEALPAFLSGAELVAYPSEGEGFGLPVLEAMACGTAVLTTDRLALPEVGGDVAYYTETSADEIADSLREVLLDRRGRHDRAAQGPERASGFTWERSADEHLGAYRQAAA